jgi:site-specific DNA-methyltransferase (adenine-specific)
MKVTDKIEITNEDNMELMARYPDKYFDLAIVDPPYGYGNKETNILNFRQKEQHREWNIAPSEQYFKELFRVSKNQIIWGGNYFPFIWNYGGRCFIYWHKGNPVENFADGELAWTSFDKNAKQFDYRYYGNLEGKTSTSEKFHPTQKPVALYKWLLDKYAKKGDKILDTHLGSGSIAIACHDYGFDLTACELDKEYFDKSIQRIKNHVSQQKLF